MTQTGSLSIFERGFALRPLAISFALVFASHCGSAQTVPALVNYQGRLANPDGSPFATADYQLSFSVYDMSTNGNLIWGPQVFDGIPAQGHGARVPVVQGYFNVILGPVDTNNQSLANAFGVSNRFIEVTVSNQPILPRQQLLTAPFAFKAADSAKLVGYDWTSLFGTNSPVGQIPFNKLARPVGTNVGIGGFALSGNSGNWTSPAPASVTLVPQMDVSLETTGRPVLLALAAGALTNSYVFSIDDTAIDLIFDFLRDGVLMGQLVYSAAGTGLPTLHSFGPNFFTWLDPAAAGIHHFQIQIQGHVNGSGTPGGVGVVNVRLAAVEL